MVDEPPKHWPKGVGYINFERWLAGIGIAAAVIGTTAACIQAWAALQSIPSI